MTHNRKALQSDPHGFQEGSMRNIMARYEEKDFIRVKAFADKNGLSMSHAISYLSLKGLKNE